MYHSPDLKIRVRFDDGNVDQPRYSIFRYPKKYPCDRFRLAPHFTMVDPQLVIEWRLKDHDIRFRIDDHHRAELVFRDLDTGCPIDDPCFEIDAPVRGRRDHICTTTCRVVPGRMEWTAVMFEMGIENMVSHRSSVIDPTII
ncbi:MAG: hypothetical protein MI919_32520, partial [Holophagales bacterium]|nr:hypothetical protein [Holophagales bacterium]